MATIKNAAEIEIMHELCRKTANILQEIEKNTKSGMSTKDIEDFVLALLKGKTEKPAFLGCYGFPAALCISVNNELIHGIPKRKRILNEGDIVSIDFGLKDKGFFSDAATTFPIGEINEEKSKLLDVCSGALSEAISNVIPGRKIGDVSNAIQTYVEKKGYKVVKKFVGHGIGRKLHESPEIPNFGAKNTGIVLKPGMTLAIEPMVTIESDDVYIDKDGSTVMSSDGKPCAHFEHTVLVTQNGAEILTK